MRRWTYLAGTVVVIAIVVIGLMQASDNKVEPEKGPKFDLEQALADLEGAPAPLAGLHEQAGELLDGGVPAFKARLAELKGHPIVINKWGSWCGPCRLEFPVFQRVGAEYGKKVAFLGIDGADPVDAAKKFLAEYPTTYPSYRDKNGTDLADVVDAGAAGFPITVFIDEDGKVVIPKAGQYTRDEELRADIKKYLGV